MKKIALLVALFVLLGANQVFAFELVDEIPKTISVGITMGSVYKLGYSAYLLGIEGSYNLSERIAIKASLGRKSTGFSNREQSIFVAIKPAWILLKNDENNFYVNAIITNFSNTFASIGAGVGIERAQLSQDFRMYGEIGYVLDGALVLNGGYKLYF